MEGTGNMLTEKQFLESTSFYLSGKFGSYAALEAYFQARPEQVDIFERICHLDCVLGYTPEESADEWWNWRKQLGDNLGYWQEVDDEPTKCKNRIKSLRTERRQQWAAARI
jgi:hypothetical protein